MIELKNLIDEVATSWPLEPLDAKPKWTNIQKTHELLTRIAQIRKHTSDETLFVSAYHQLLSKYGDSGILKDIERGSYDDRYLPLDLAKNIVELDSKVNHR